MQDISTDSKLPIFKKGLIAAACACLLFVAFFLGLAYSNPLSALDTGRQIIGLWIHVAAMIGGLYWLRVSRPNGDLHFWEALMLNSLITLLLPIVAGLTVYCYTEIFPEHLAAYKNWIVEVYLPKIKDISEQMEKGSYAKKVAFNQSLTPIDLAVGEFQRNFMFCIVLGLVTGLIMRRKSNSSS